VRARCVEPNEPEARSETEEGDPVKKLYLTAAGLALCAALIAATGAIAKGSATTIRLTTALTAAQEVPTPTGAVSDARGGFTATVTRSGAGASIQWTLAFSGLTGNAIAAHIHTGARGEAGPVTVPLCGPCESPASGTATIDAAVLAAIHTGRAYANVHTRTNPGGEIRGQLAAVATVRTALNARQEVPRPRGAGRARGLFTATATKSGASAVVTWRLTFSRLTGRALAAHIHIGARGRAGGVAVALCGPCRSGVRGRATVTGATLAALESGRAYVNVHTRRNPAGEIRGQIAAVPLTITL
jgi:CHRD domain